MSRSRPTRFRPESATCRHSTQRITDPCHQAQEGQSKGVGRAGNTVLINLRYQGCDISCSCNETSKEARDNNQPSAQIEGPQISRTRKAPNHCMGYCPGGRMARRWALVQDGTLGVCKGKLRGPQPRAPLAVLRARSAECRGKGRRFLL